jgi:hypothetical protein
MNTVGEKIEISEIIKSCREMNPQELLQLLRADFWKFSSWGATGFTVDNMRKPRMMRFKSNGYKHKGHVYIFVNGNDLFDVYLTTIQGKIIEISGDMGLYFDMLVDWIDERIEKQADYVR